MKFWDKYGHLFIMAGVVIILVFAAKFYQQAVERRAEQALESVIIEEVLSEDSE